jgi:hypothetical protein
MTFEHASTTPQHYPRQPIRTRRRAALAPALLAAALATTGLAASADAACLTTPGARIVKIPPSQPAPLSLRPQPGSVLDLRGLTLRAIPVKNPLVVFFASGGTCVTGVKIAGNTPPAATWTQVKASYDSDGVRFSTASGPFVLENASIVNVADAVAPPKAPDTPRTARFTVRGVYAARIRDDFVENDAALNGEIRDTLVDGTHVFLSARPGAGNSKARFDSGLVRVHDTLVRLDCKPDDRSDGSCGAGMSLGMPFKWSPAAAGLKVEVVNTIIRVDAEGRNGPRSMDFPAGSYHNVTLIWLGQGPYPGKLPASGVKVTRDTKLWDRARAAWLARRGCPSSGCLGR